MYHRFWVLLKRMGMARVARIDKAGGSYDDGGVWVPGAETLVPISPAAVLTLTDDMLAHDAGGTYSADDRKLVCYAPLAEGQELVANGIRYMVFGKRDYSDYAPGLHSYVIRRVGEAGD